MHEGNIDNNIIVVRDDVGYDKEEINNAPKQSLFKWPMLLANDHEILKRVSKNMLLHPIIWGIVVGFILSLSTLGQYLKPSSKNSSRIYGEWFIGVTDWFGSCVSPISLFTMGLWMSSLSGVTHSQERQENNNNMQKNITLLDDVNMLHVFKVCVHASVNDWYHKKYIPFG